MALPLAWEMPPGWGCSGSWTSAHHPAPLWLCGEGTSPRVALSRCHWCWQLCSKVLGEVLDAAGAVL